jgi:hypothetical protein
VAVTTAEEIADSVLLLAGERATNLTGEDIIIDGGLTQSLLEPVIHPSRTATFVEADIGFLAPVMVRRPPQPLRESL